MYYSEGFNSNYMGLVGYETCDKLIWTSGEVFINKNTISKQLIPKSIINKISPSSTLFLVFPHISTLVISCQNIWFHADYKHTNNNKGGGYIEIFK